jgi:hypothetical protein
MLKNSTALKECIFRVPFLTAYVTELLGKNMCKTGPMAPVVASYHGHGRTMGIHATHDTVPLAQMKFESTCRENAKTF